MKNSMLDLHNHLFAQLERLSDESVKGDHLREELSRAKAVMGVADVLVQNAALEACWYCDKARRIYV